jgi:hypothetical protein
MGLFQKIWALLTRKKYNPVDLSKQKGDVFENYVIQKFDRAYFALKDMRSDKGVKGFYPESNTYPDLTLEYKPAKQRFAVECKWRQHWQTRSNGSAFINWAGGTTKEKGLQKIQNYANYAETQKMPVFVVIGIGGTPERPKDLYVVPLNALKSPFVDRPYLTQFQRRDLSRNFFFDAKKLSLTL